MKNKIVELLSGFTKNIQSCGLNSSSHVLVACSGGSDSMLLLYLMIQARNLGIIKKVSAAHINHNIRSSSEDDEMCVVNYCNKNDVPVFVRQTNPEEIDSFGLGTEAGARYIRYNFFDNIILLEDIDILVTGHHVQDRLETMMMRICDSTANISSLSSPSEYQRYQSISNEKRVDYSHNVFIIRPLIHLWPEEISLLRVDSLVPFVQDKSNFETVYLRNKFRHHVIPVIKEHSSHNGAIAKSLKQLQDDADVYNYLLDEKIKNIVVEEYSNAIVLDLKSFECMPDKICLAILHSVNKNLHSQFRFNSIFIHQVLKEIRIVMSGSLTPGKSHRAVISQRRRVEVSKDKVYIMLTEDDPKHVRWSTFQTKEK